MSRNESSTRSAGRLAPLDEYSSRTVANLEAIDHVYLFRTIDEIRDMITARGFLIEGDFPYVVPGCEEDDPLPANYFAIIVPN